MAQVTNTGRRMKIGLMPGLEEKSYAGITPRFRDIQALAQRAEQVGFDSFWLADRAPRGA